ncbi:MAG: hypothetical protein N3E46_07450 [Gemmataceae bacterium]|nr:hypothetical protein [Gemmataceae bacterium]
MKRVCTRPTLAAGGGRTPRSWGVWSRGGAIGGIALGLLALFGVGGGTGSGRTAQAQVREPARPDKVTVLIRYQILTERNQRILQYRAFSKYLESLGFVDERADEEERASDALDPAAYRLQGVMTSANILRVLEYPAVQSLLVAPPGFSWSEEPDQAVPVRIILRSGMTPRQQRLLHRQVLERLAGFGFQEALGYDTLGFTQIKGRLPRKFLLALWRDFRDQPTGWFWSATPREELPSPLRDASPIRWVEVLPGGEAGQRLAPAFPEGVEARWSPELRARLADAAAANKPLRVEVLFPETMEAQTRQLQSLLDANFGGALAGGGGSPLRTNLASVEGVVGNVVTIHFERASDVKHFSTLVPYLLLLRLPQSAIATCRMVPRLERALPLEEIVRQTGASALHQRGYRGQGVRVVLLVTDLEGVAAEIGKTLPRSTRWIDLTSELNPDLRPLPVAKTPDECTGLKLAQALAAIAPEAELVLLRIDPSALFQVAEVARWSRDRDYLSPALVIRGREMERQIQLALERKQRAIQKRQEALQKPGDEEALRQLLQQSLAEVQRAEAALAETYARYDRYLRLRQELQSLVYGAAVIVNPWAWEAGYPLDGCSPLSRQVEGLLLRPSPRIISPTRPVSTPSLPPPVWVQAASVTHQTVWTGLFRDEDGNGLLEFVPAGSPLPRDHWSRELNFLAWQTDDGQERLDLPAGCTFRCTLQWREPLEGETVGALRPIYPVSLRLWKQLDPSGQKQASDEMSEAARSVGGPYPIFLGGGSVVYEQILEFRPAEAGRYAVVIDLGVGRSSPLAAWQRQVEIYPRLLVETLSPGGAAGRVVLQSFPSGGGGVGLPGDIAEAVTIGADVPGQLQQGGPSIALRRKPDYLLPEAVAWGTAASRGTAVGTAIGGGMAALLVHAGVSDIQPFRKIGLADGAKLHVPPAWLQRLPPR